MKNIKKIVIAVVLVSILVVSAILLAGCNVDKVKVIDIKLTQEEYAFGVKKGNTELLNQINGALEEIKSDGTVDAIMAKYFDGAEVTGYSSPAKNASKNQLVVATNAEFAPFEYKEGDKFCGIDIEMMQAIATKLGKELVVEHMEFDAVVTSVGTGLADVAAAGLTVNEERKKSVDFTNKYYDASQMIVVAKDDTTFDACTTAEEVIAVMKKLEGNKAGFQRGTTSEYFVIGDADWDFAGFSNIEAKKYDNAGIAVTDMLNGNINFVVVDEMPAKTIIRKMNR